MLVGVQMLFTKFIIGPVKIAYLNTICRLLKFDAWNTATALNTSFRSVSESIIDLKSNILANVNRIKFILYPQVTSIVGVNCIFKGLHTFVICAIANRSV